MNRVNKAALILVLLFAVLPLAESSTVTTFCVKSNTASLSGVNCSSRAIVVHSVESQKVSSCSEKASDNKWLTNGSAVHLVWFSCNLRSNTCTPSTISSKNTYYIRVKYSCITSDELNSMRRMDLCANVSKVVATPMFLQSPGYTNYFTFSDTTNCTCSLSVVQDNTDKGTFTVTVNDMITIFPEDITLLSNADRYVLSTKMDPESYHIILNQVSVPNLSDVHLSFLPARNPQFAKSTHQGYFWMEVKSTANLNISITCNSALLTSTTQPPMTAAPTSLSTAAPSTLSTAAPTTLSTAAPTSLSTAAPTSLSTAAPTSLSTAAPTSLSTAAPSTVTTVAASPPGLSTVTSSTGHTNGTDGPVSPPIAVAGGSLPDKMIIIISVVVPVILVVIIVINVVVVTVVLKRRAAGDRNRDGSNEVTVLPSSETSEGVDLFGDAASAPPGDAGVIYAEISAPVENGVTNTAINIPGDSGVSSAEIREPGIHVGQGHVQTRVQGHPVEGRLANDDLQSNIGQTNEYSKLDDFAPHVYDDLGVESRSNDNDDYDDTQVQGHPLEGRQASGNLEPNVSGANEYSKLGDFEPHVYSDLVGESRSNDNDNYDDTQIQGHPVEGRLAKGNLEPNVSQANENIILDDFDPRVYNDLGGQSRSNDNDIKNGDRAYANARRHRSKSPHTYENIGNGKFADSDFKVDDRLYFRDGKHRKEVVALVNVQRTEL